jgi:hypothetical protein
MIRNRRHIVIGLVALTVIGLVCVYMLHYGDALALERVTLDGEPVENWAESLGLKPQRPLHRQPVKEAVARLLERDDVVKVDLDYELPDGLTITTNRFEPACFLLCARTGRLHGLNDQGWLVEVPDDHRDWEHPIIVGLSAGTKHQPCADVRVSLLLDELAELRDEQTDLYVLISEIDMSAPDRLVVTVSGLPFTLTMTADRFFSEMHDFVQFLECYQPGLDGVRSFDLRYENMIVQAGGGRVDG